MAGERSTASCTRMGQTLSSAIHRSARRSSRGPLADACKATGADEDGFLLPVVHDCTAPTACADGTARARHHRAGFSVRRGCRRCVGHPHRSRRDPVVRSELQAERATLPGTDGHSTSLPGLAAGPRRAHSGTDRVDKPHRIGTPWAMIVPSTASRAASIVQRASSNQALLGRELFDRRLFSRETDRIGEPPKLHAKPRGFVGAAGAFGNV